MVCPISFVSVRAARSQRNRSLKRVAWRQPWAEKDPTEKNKAKLEEELQTQIDMDSVFAAQLQELVQQLQAQNEKIRQVVVSEIELTGG